TLHRHTDDALGAQIRRLNDAFRLYAETGAPTVILLVARNVYAEVLARAGRVEEALTLLRGVFAELAGGGPGFVVAHNRLALANVLCEARAFADAEAHAQALLARPGLSAGYQAMARDVLAQSRAALGDLTGAEEQARAAIALSPHTPVRRWLMTAHLGRALTGQGRAAEARAAIGEALHEVDEGGTGGGFAELPILVAAAEAAEAEGLAAEAETFTDRARRWAARQIAGLDGDDAIRAFLAALPERARPSPLTRP
ncbi:MAG: hypothetical protein U0359_36855, partial [Byssovorax sp.]